MEQGTLDGFEPPSAEENEGWFKGPPPMTGWWRTRRVGKINASGDLRRYHDGTSWSLAVRVGDDDEDMLEAMSGEADEELVIEWQGLAEPAAEYDYTLTLIPPYGRTA